MLVNEIMTPNPACCTPDSPLYEVARMMQQNDCGCIPVVESMAGMRPVGTITDRDITIRTVAASRNPIDMRASDVMTADVATVTPRTSIDECLDVMQNREIRRVLVVDEQGRCCGIVAQADIVESPASPIKVTNTIRDISESAPSSTRRAGHGGRGRGYRSSGSSLFSSGTLLPLLIGLGSGVALTYLLNSKRGQAGDYIEGRDREEYVVDLANSERLGKYPDAEEEIERRQQELEQRRQTLLNESELPANNRPESQNADDEATAKHKEQGAGNM